MRRFGHVERRDEHLMEKLIKYELRIKTKEKTTNGMKRQCEGVKRKRHVFRTRKGGCA